MSKWIKTQKLTLNFEEFLPEILFRRHRHLPGHVPPDSPHDWENSVGWFSKGPEDHFGPHPVFLSSFSRDPSSISLTTNPRILLWFFCLSCQMKLELRLKWRCEGSSPATSPSTTAELQCQEITCPAPLLLLSHLEQADTTTQRTSQRESEKKRAKIWIYSFLLRLL